MPEIEASDIVARLGLQEEQYFVVSAHREENINTDNFFSLIDSINAIAEIYQLPIIVSTHPRPRQMIDKQGVEFSPLVRLMKPLGFIDYVKLQMKAKSSLE